MPIINFLNRKIQEIDRLKDKFLTSIIHGDIESCLEDFETLEKLSHDLGIARDGLQKQYAESLFVNFES